MKKHHIHIFRTSVENAADIIKLRQLLNDLAGDGGSWNFDLEDCDRILRLESVHFESQQICATIKSEGYFIEELED